MFSLCEAGKLWENKKKYILKKTEKKGENIREKNIPSCVTNLNLHQKVATYTDTFLARAEECLH